MLKCKCTQWCVSIDQFCVWRLANKCAHARFTFVLALSLFPQVPGIMPYHRSYVHMAYALCTNDSFQYKVHMPCVPRPPLSTKDIVRVHDFIARAWEIYSLFVIYRAICSKKGKITTTCVSFLVMNTEENLPKPV